MRVRPLPAQSHHEGWRFESFAAGLEAVRRLAQDGPRPTVLRLSDEVETMIGAAGSGRSDGGCLLIAGYEGADVRPTAEAAADVLAAHGGVPLGTQAGQQWARHRFDAPYLRDALLDHVPVVVTPDDAPGEPVEVTQRLVQGLVRMGFLGAGEGRAGAPGADDVVVRTVGRWVGLVGPYGATWSQKATDLAVRPATGHPFG
nr:FAD-linked oxidase C-terminal domain-containing protein [Micromonospora phytophila]